jgi:hypothetical protein
MFLAGFAGAALAAPPSGGTASRPTATSATTPPHNPDEPYGADLFHGSSPAQMFNSSCGVCHKTPSGLASRAPGNLTNFLRQHYTTGEAQAAAMAQYLASVGGSGNAGRAHTPAGSNPSEPEQKPAAAREGEKNDKKKHEQPAEGPANRRASRPEKPEEGKPAESKPAEAKPEEKPKETKPAEAKPAEPKPAATRERRSPRVHEANKPAEPEKPAPAAEQKPEQPAASAAPPPEPKPAAPPPPQIPL